MKNLSTKIEHEVSPDLFLSIVIPCYHEPEILSTLKSLYECDKPDFSTEIILVINHSEDSSAEIKRYNNNTLEEVNNWIRNNQADYLNLFVLLENLEAKNAGVGLARKIGMDEACLRFQSINKKDGIIVCLDADCTVQKNYLCEIGNAFKNNSKAVGCSISFEHPLHGKELPEIYKAITLYEFYLRYYINSLRWAGHPFAFQTIGSSMAVRSEIYTQQGGMNKRKAGEDFYFLNKVIELGNFIELKTTTVYPSPRISSRVPFGTGKAVADYIDEESSWFYDFKAFEDLKSFFESVISSPSKKFEALTNLPYSMKEFFEKEDFKTEFDQIGGNSSDENAYKKRFFRWFNLFKVLKFVHHFSDNVLPKENTHEAARELFLHLKLPFTRNLVDDLITIRKYDREN